MILKTVRAYELGYRIFPSDTVAIDIATFYNEYDKLITPISGAPYPAGSPTPHLILPMTLANDIEGETCGVGNFYRLDAAIGLEAARLLLRAAAGSEQNE